LSRTKAAVAVGVTKKTVCEWMRLARSGKSPPHLAFRTAVLEAEARFVADQLTVILRSATPHLIRTVRTRTRSDGQVVTEVTEREVSDWRAAAGLLKCAAAEEFGDHREELAKLKREVAELRQDLLSDAPARGWSADP
jgi:hypothetical protein